MKTDPNEPVWSLNLKKGLLSGISFRIDKEYVEESVEILEKKENKLVEHAREKLEYSPMFSIFEVFKHLKNEKLFPHCSFLSLMFLIEHLL